MKILFLDGSLTTPASYSTNVMNYLHEYVKNQKYDVERVDLNNSIFSKINLNNNTFKDYWTKTDSDKWISKLKETNLLVISTSMVNFNTNAVVKNFIDSIAVAEKTFSYKYSLTNEAIGFLTNLNVLIIGSQGAEFGRYPWGNHIEWLKGTFKFLGVKNVQTINLLGTKTTELSKMTPKEYVDNNSSYLEKTINEFLK
ncbi:FMN-dependent NADH-azoreductase [Mycoplasma leonicaptivi]|uniref:FMN-dependent NADH-azoreductase n=1 Tax=Mycoplasma leonicaptivi TaxID=36742 RepID=UPI00047F37AC|nr:FMN-dependent NADH-azoreductase [Mycoplasma leonicaptivi]